MVRSNWKFDLGELTHKYYNNLPMSQEEKQEFNDRYAALKNSIQSKKDEGRLVTNGNC